MGNGVVGRGVSCGSGCSIHEVSNIFAQGANRYHCLKEHAEVELDALRFKMESLASKNATLRERNSDLRRNIAANPALKRRGGNDGRGRGRGTQVSSRTRLRVVPLHKSYFIGMVVAHKILVVLSCSTWVLSLSLRGGPFFDVLPAGSYALTWPAQAGFRGDRTTVQSIVLCDGILLGCRRCV